MPIYDYICGTCRHRFEVFHGLNENGPQHCPLCEGRVRRAWAAPAIHFKGSGWAKVDRRYGGAPKRKRSQESAGEAPAAKTESPSEGDQGSSNDTKAAE